MPIEVEDINTCREKKMFEKTHPRNKTLVESSNPTTTPNGLTRLPHCLRTVGSHLRLQDL